MTPDKLPLQFIQPFEVSHAQRPTLRGLCAKLEQLARARGTLPSTVPVSVQAKYVLSSQASYRNTTSDVGWHLHAPAAASVAALSCDALVRGGYVQPGQIVNSGGSKLLTNESSNVLIVEIVQLDTPCKEDFKLLQHKLLEWYLEQCTVKNVLPTRITYRMLLKKLISKSAKNSKEPFDVSTVTGLGSNILPK